VYFWEVDTLPILGLKLPQILTISNNTVGTSDKSTAQMYIGKGKVTSSNNACKGLTSATTNTNAKEIAMLTAIVFVMPPFVNPLLLLVCSAKNNCERESIKNAIVEGAFAQQFCPIA
jgi:hypothetical protein